MGSCSSQSVAKQVEVKTSQEEAEAVQMVDLDRLGLVFPSVPGDVVLCGHLPWELLGEVAEPFGSWIYLGKESDSEFFRAEIEAAGVRCVVLPYDPPSISEARLRDMDAALNSMPRPLMLQCSTGLRAGAAMLLWLARQRGYSAKSAAQLAADLDLHFFTRCSTCGPMREWLLDQLPREDDAHPFVLASSQGGAVVQQLYDPQTSTLSYVVGCRESGEAVLIDPVLERRERDLATVDELGFTLRYVINTHCHSDHVTSGSALREARPGVRTIISKASGARADFHVSHGDRVTFGRLSLEVRATPGHTNGCVSFVLAVPGQPPMVFTGDALLIRGCGRCDFSQGDAGKLYDSVHSQIFSLPPETRVYPGHDYKGRSVSTVGEEKKFNPRLTMAREEFIKVMKSRRLPLPKMANTALASNMACGVQS